MFPTSNSSVFYKLKELTREQKPENATEAQTTITVLPYDDFNTESRAHWKAFEHKTTQTELVRNITVFLFLSHLLQLI